MWRLPADDYRGCLQAPPNRQGRALRGEVRVDGSGDEEGLGGEQLRQQ